MSTRRSRRQPSASGIVYDARSSPDTDVGQPRGVEGHLEVAAVDEHLGPRPGVGGVGLGAQPSPSRSRSSAATVATAVRSTEPPSCASAAASTAVTSAGGTSPCAQQPRAEPVVGRPTARSGSSVSAGSRAATIATGSVSAMPCRSRLTAASGVAAPVSSTRSSGTTSASASTAASDPAADVQPACAAARPTAGPVGRDARSRRRRPRHVGRDGVVDVGGSSRHEASAVP